MSALQDFINRRGTGRGAQGTSRPESPVKGFQGHSSIPQPTRVPIRDTDRLATEPSQHHNKNINQNRSFEEDEYKDSEILSLENQDEEQQIFSQQHARNNLPPEFNHGVYRWQSGVQVADRESVGSEGMTDGRSTPRPNFEPDDSPVIKHPEEPEQFFTTMEINSNAKKVFEDHHEGAGNTTQAINRQLNGISIISDLWQDLDSEYNERIQSKGPDDAAIPIPFDVNGMLEAVAKLGVSLRGGEKLKVYDHLDHYKLYAIEEPSHPYLIGIPYQPLSGLEIVKMRADLATMAYVRRYHPSIPTPEVIYNDLDRKNPSGVPFMVIRQFKGEYIHNQPGGVEAVLRDRRKALVILENLSKIHAELTKPGKGMPLDKLGDIYLKTDKSNRPVFTIGSFTGTLNEDVSLESEYDMRTKIDGNLLDLCTSIFEASESSSLADAPNRQLRSIKRRLAGLLGLLPAPPSHYSPLCLFHTSLSLSSILVNPSDLSITCILNWRDAHVLPFLLTAVYPAEIRPNNTPWALWTDEENTDDEYWGLRGAYEARLAKFDPRFAGDIWEDEQAGTWMKVWEVVSGGPAKWIEKRRWIEQMFSELAAKSHII